MRRCACRLFLGFLVTHISIAFVLVALSFRDKFTQEKTTLETETDSIIPVLPPPQLLNEKSSDNIFNSSPCRGVAPGKLKAWQPVFIVVVDANSIDTGVYVYAFLRCCLDNRFILQKEDYFSIEDSILHYISPNKQIRSLLLPLLRKAVVAVPVRFRRYSPILVRLSPALYHYHARVRSRILHRIRVIVKRFPFVVKNSQITITKDYQKAADLWLAANFLTGRMYERKKSESELLAIDLGGDTFNIAYPVNSKPEILQAMAAKRISEIYPNKTSPKEIQNYNRKKYKEARKRKVEYIKYKRKNLKGSAKQAKKQNKLFDAAITGSKKSDSKNNIRHNNKKKKIPPDCEKTSKISHKLNRNKCKINTAKSAETRYRDRRKIKKLNQSHNKRTKNVYNFSNNNIFTNSNNEITQNKRSNKLTIISSNKKHKKTRINLSKEIELKEKNKRKKETSRTKESRKKVSLDNEQNTNASTGKRISKNKNKKHKKDFTKSKSSKIGRNKRNINGSPYIITYRCSPTHRYGISALSFPLGIFPARIVVLKSTNETKKDELKNAVLSTPKNTQKNHEGNNVHSTSEESKKKNLDPSLIFLMKTSTVTPTLTSTTRRRSDLSPEESYRVNIDSISPLALPLDKLFSYFDTSRSLSVLSKIPIDYNTSNIPSHVQMENEKSFSLESTYNNNNDINNNVNHDRKWMENSLEKLKSVVDSILTSIESNNTLNINATLLQNVTSQLETIHSQININRPNSNKHMHKTHPTLETKTNIEYIQNKSILTPTLSHYNGNKMINTSRKIKSDQIFNKYSPVNKHKTLKSHSNSQLVNNTQQSATSVNALIPLESSSSDFSIKTPTKVKMSEINKNTFSKKLFNFNKQLNQSYFITEDSRDGVDLKFNSLDNKSDSISRLNKDFKSTQKLIRATLADILFGVSPSKINSGYELNLNKNSVYENSTSNTNEQTDTNASKYTYRQTKFITAWPNFPFPKLNPSPKSEAIKPNDELLLKSSCLSSGSYGQFYFDGLTYTVIGKDQYDISNDQYYLSNGRGDSVSMKPKIKSKIGIDCWSEVIQIVKSHIQLPQIVNVEVIASTAFYFIASSAHLIEPGSQFGYVEVQQFRNVADKMCERASHQLPDPMACLDYQYVAALLIHGLGLPPNQKIMVCESIDNFKLTWALGNALDFLQRK